MRVIYVDTLFLLNFTVDYGLLLLTHKISGVYTKRIRLLLGAAAGAILAIMLYFLPSVSVLVWALRLASCPITVLAAFGVPKGRSWLRLCGVFLLLTMLLGGLVMVFSIKSADALSRNGVLYFDLSVWVMLLGFLLLFALSSFVLGKGGGNVSRSWREIQVEMAGRELHFRALVDSGNLLRDPLSGRQVIVVQAALVANLFTDTGAVLLHYFEEYGAEDILVQLRRCCKTAFWLLPVHTAAQDTMLLVFRPEKLLVDGRPSDAYLLGLTGQRLEIGGDCHALIGV